MEVTHFSAERTPVSLGIVIDTSGSMAGDKWLAARDAIERFLDALPDPQDEFFMYRFSADADLVHDWTNERQDLKRSLARVNPAGGTAMYDAVAEAVPMAQGGQNRKKAIVLISDGNDTNSRLDVGEVRQLVRETEVLVYAVGIDGQRGDDLSVRVRRRPSCGRRHRFRFRCPGAGGVRAGCPSPFRRCRGRAAAAAPRAAECDDRVNVVALREITDDSGGRTEIVRDARDLDPATAGIADELSKQVLHRLSQPGPSRRSLAHHPPRGARWIAQSPRPPRVHRDSVARGSKVPLPSLSTVRARAHSAKTPRKYTDIRRSGLACRSQ